MESHISEGWEIVRILIWLSRSVPIADERLECYAGDLKESGRVHKNCAKVAHKENCNTLTWYS
jgi:hypothetical protein